MGGARGRGEPVGCLIMSARATAEGKEEGTRAVQAKCLYGPRPRSPESAAEGVCDMPAVRIRVLPYDEALIQEQGGLFPAEVFEDLWVAYHGTSGARAAQIEASGLEWPARLVSKAQVERVHQRLPENELERDAQRGLARL